VWGPWRARDFFKIPMKREEGPIWTFDRMGNTATELPDGRVVCVAGEHEDYYDPDFYIYNDVVVFTPAGDIEIYGYPKDVFPPTDFHSATLLGDQIILIGCMGYDLDRRSGHTPVYALNLSDYHIEEIKTSGEMPGWISEHEAEVNADGIVLIRGGDVFEKRGDRWRRRRNLEEYALDVRSGVWGRVTNRNWPQFTIHRADRKVFDERPEPEHLLPRTVDYVVLPRTKEQPEENVLVIAVEGLPVVVTVEFDEIWIVVQGELPDELLLRVAEEMRSAAEAAIQQPCIFERL
jgi:hypothetical protein